MDRDESRQRVLSDLAPPSALAPFRIRNYRFQWPADLLTSWAFEMETLILGWYVLVETGSVLLLTAVRLARLYRYAGSADVRRRRRPHRPSRSAGDDARDLCGAGGRADDAGAVRPPRTALRVHDRGRDGRRPAVGPRRARRAGGDHHAARPADRRDQHFPHHDGYRAHRRRAERRRIVRRARDGAGLCGDRLPLYYRDRADAVHRGAGKAAARRARPPARRCSARRCATSRRAWPIAGPRRGCRPRCGSRSSPT